MSAARRWVLSAAVTGVLCLAASDQALAQATPLPKSRPAAADKAAITSDTRVYLLRGLLNVFSLGMDDLAEKLTRRGIRAEVYNHDNWTAIAAEVVNDYKRGQKGPVVLIGHSLGADVLFWLAERLDKENIPVKLVVPFDPTGSFEVPKNVAHLLNFYQLNGWGRRVNAGAGFRGELNNVDLSEDKSIGHGSIDKSERLHNMVIAKIMQVGGKSSSRKRRASAKKPVPAAAKSNAAVNAAPGSKTGSKSPATAPAPPASPRT